MKNVQYKKCYDKERNHKMLKTTEVRKKGKSLKNKDITSKWVRNMVDINAAI